MSLQTFSEPAMCQVPTSPVWSLVKSCMSAVCLRCGPDLSVHFCPCSNQATVNDSSKLSIAVLTNLLSKPLSKPLTNMASSWPLNGFILLSISVPENEIQAGGRRRRGMMSRKEKVERPVYMLQQCRRFLVSSNRTSSNRTSSNSNSQSASSSVFHLSASSAPLLFFPTSIFLRKHLPPKANNPLSSYQTC